MAVVISLGIAVLVVGFVAAPFFLLTRRPLEPAAKNPDTPEALRELLEEKETIYAAIQELDFDFKSGKLSVADHQALRQRHEAQAAAVLKRIDDLQEAARQTETPQAARRGRRSG